MDVPLWARVAMGIGVATVLAFMSTPVAIVAARRFGFFDRPAGYKAHAAPTPYLGGAAVVAAFAIALFLGAGEPVRTVPLLAGVLVLLVVGTLDDLRSLSPLTRVTIEFALGALLAGTGLGWHLGAGRLPDILVNGAWIVAVVNAFNLFDNMDGAASTMGVVVAGGACVLALITHQPWVSAGSAALCGACLGFLPHNLSRPARIFLGDGGSMPLGFAVAVLVATAARGAEPSALAMLVGFLLVGIPALDTSLVIVSRRRRGVSFLTGGQDHLTHRARRRMLTARKVALVLGSVQALVSALVIVATREGSTLLVYIMLAFVVCAAAAVVGLEQAGVLDETAADRTGARVKLGRVGRANLPGTRWSSRVAMVAVLILGIGIGISALFSAYYDVGVWVPLGLGVTIAAGAAAVARPPRVTLPMLLALLGLTGLGLWSLVSTSWASGVEAATIEANQWLAYGALLVLMLVLVASRRRAQGLMIAIAVGIGVVALTVIARMFGSDPGSLFLHGRLNNPLGYTNGEGCLFAMAAWGGVALAERREPLVAGLGAAAAVFMASLALLSQSRGAALASFVALVVLLVAVPGWRRRVFGLVVIAAGVAVAARPVLHVYTQAAGGAVVPASAHRAALAILLSSVGAGAVWAGATALVARLERNPGSRRTLRRAATGIAAALLVMPVIAAGVAFPSLRRTASRQWHAFVHLSAKSSSAAAQTRLLSGGGNRYDYWRIAWHAFEDHPVAGLGAGNYSTAYFEQRRTQEAVQNPHSLELQTLSELGVVGGALLGLLIAGVVVGAVRMRRVARVSLTVRTMMVAATGGVVVWFVDTSGDWMHLLPGLTAVALAAAAVLCRDWQGERADPVARPPRTGARLPMLIGATAVAFVLAVTGAGLARTALAQYYLDHAKGELGGNPHAAIKDAGRALRLDGANLDAYYIKAAGQARFDQAAASRATLLAAAREDPENFVTWTLLGDLEVRLRNFSAARTFYGRAHALDPRDPGLAVLAKDPASALSNPGG